MTIKNFYFSQLADMRIEGVGIHASFSISLVVKDENTTDGKKYISLQQVKLLQLKLLVRE